MAESELEKCFLEFVFNYHALAHLHWSIGTAPLPGTAPFFPQIAIAIGVLTSNFGGVDVVPLCYGCREGDDQGAIVVCYGAGGPTSGDWTW